MARIATIGSKQELSAEDQPIYDAIAKSRGRVGGPFTVLLHSPPIAERTAHLGTYIRFESRLDPRIVELTALAAARELECKHEWAAHVEHARKAGVPLETIRLIHQRKEPQSLPFEEAQIVSYVQELLRSHRVSEATFQALYGRLGEQGLVELTATVGYYAMLACTLNAFDVATVKAPEEFEI